MAQAEPTLKLAIAATSIILSLLSSPSAFPEGRRLNRQPGSQHPSRFDPKNYSSKIEASLALKVYKSNGQIPRALRVLSVNQKTIDYFFVYDGIDYLCTNSHESLTDLSERPICTNLSALSGPEDLRRGKIRRFRRNSNGSYNIVVGEFAFEQFQCKVFPGNQFVQSCVPWKQIQIVGH
ncbi:MAG: hypothetical protein IT288_00125 [Bdellovibrionales bacterium]|nr:hypothetical protein [Bdellovibrionales bacterium]